MRIPGSIPSFVVATSWLLALPSGAGAQFPDRIKEAVEDEAERQVENRARQGIAGLFRCVWNDLECIRGAEERGEQVALTDEEGNVLTDEEGDPVSDPAEAEAAMARRRAGTVVGTIEMTVAGETRVFEVREGAPGEGFATGYNQQPRAGSLVLGASLQGRERGSEAKLRLSVAVWRETLEHMCDPFANQVVLSPADPDASGGRLRPDGTPSTTCPPPPDGGRGGLAVHLDLTEATLDEETGELHVAGTFAGPLGRGEDAVQVTGGRFDATLRPFGEL